MTTARNFAEFFDIGDTGRPQLLTDPELERTDRRPHWFPHILWRPLDRQRSPDGVARNPQRPSNHLARDRSIPPSWSAALPRHRLSCRGTVALRVFPAQRADEDQRGRCRDDDTGDCAEEEQAGALG
jgi:hypothetical protein